MKNPWTITMWISAVLYGMAIGIWISNFLPKEDQEVDLSTIPEMKCFIPTTHMAGIVHQDGKLRWEGGESIWCGITVQGQLASVFIQPLMTQKVPLFELVNRTITDDDLRPISRREVCRTGRLDGIDCELWHDKIRCSGYGEILHIPLQQSRDQDAMDCIGYLEDHNVQCLPLHNCALGLNICPASDFIKASYPEWL